MVAKMKQPAGPGSGAIPLPSGGWPTKRPLGGAANVPATTVEHAVQFDQFDSWSFMIPTP